MITLELQDENQSTDFAELLAEIVQQPCRIFLQGDLGVGKTTLVRGYLRALSYEGRVKSPTFSLLEVYDVSIGVVHIDLYRLESSDELLSLGLEDYWDNMVIFVEWPERGQGVLKDADLSVALSMHGAGRKCTISAQTPLGESLMKNLQQQLGHHALGINKNES